MSDPSQDSNAMSDAPSSSSSAATATALPARSLTDAQKEQIRLNLQRYIRQLTVGCGRAGCTNAECVTGGAAPLAGAAALTKAKALYSSGVPSCVPATNVHTASGTTGSSSTPAAVPTASSTSSTIPSTPANSITATTTVAATPVAAAASTELPLQTPARPPVVATPQAPTRPASSSLSSSASSSPIIRPFGTPAAAAAAAASSSSAVSSSSSSSTSTRKVPVSLQDMLSGIQAPLPVKAEEEPITDVNEWVMFLAGLQADWEAKGSPHNDFSALRPAMNRLYKVFNDFNCLNLSFRSKKAPEDIKADQQLKAKLEEKKSKQKEAEQSKPVTATDPNAMIDVEPSTSSAPSYYDAYLESTLSSPYVDPTEYSPAVDYEKLEAFYGSIYGVVATKPDGSEERPLLNSLINGFRAMLQQILFRPWPANQCHPAFLRALPILYQNPGLWFDPSPSNYDLLKLLCKVIATLPSSAKRIIISWMSDVEKWSATPDTRTQAQKDRMFSMDKLEQLLGALQQFISVRIYEKIDSLDVNDISPAVVVISLIHEANEGLARFTRSLPLAVPKIARIPVTIPPTAFYNDAVNEHTNLQDDFVRWVRQSRHATPGQPQPFTFYRYNFMLDAGSKANLLKYDSQMQQHHVYRDSVLSNGMNERAGYLILEVRRSHLIEDTMKALAKKSGSDLKKPLKIHFIGEKGIDAGGLRKEFFSLLLSPSVATSLFNPNYGMFLEDAETHRLRFNPDSLDSPLEFELIGSLIGLAIYNSTILDMQLPTVTYKKLLGLKADLDDLIDFNPSLGKGLQQLLEFEGDVENTFSRDFTLSYESYGEQKLVELIPNGANIPVTNENKHQFVDLYVDFVLDKSIAKQFNAFNKGFHRVVGGEALQLFRPFELELLICGIPEFDFEGLEKSAQYEDGYTADSTIIKQFWEIVHEELDLEQKKRLLEFATGSDRVPIRGLGSLRLTISKQGPDSNQLPTSHTCFNHMLLPDYSSKEKLRQYLLLALQHSKGFGLI